MARRASSLAVLFPALIGLGGAFAALGPPPKTAAVATGSATSVVSVRPVLGGRWPGC